MNFPCKLVFVFLLTGAIAASAQDYFGPLATSLPKMKAVFSKLVPDIPDFSAKATVGMFDPTNKLLAKMPMDFTLTADRMRQEIDVMNMPFPQEVRDAMQKSHLDKIDIITQTDAKKVFIVFPGIQAYQEYPISDAVLDEMTTRANAVNIQKKEFGQRTIDNHPCTAFKLTVTETNKPPEYAILACASDLQNFPIRLDIYTKTSTTRFIFEDVQLNKPDAALFEVPPNYTAFVNTADILRYAKEKFQSSSDNAPQ